MTLRVGVVGCGNISDIYLSNAGRFKAINVVACADLKEELASAKAERYRIAPRSVEALIASEDVDIVLNLTVPEAHATISLQAIAAGKHVFTEKPLATRFADGEAVLKAAAQKGLEVGCAPDTVLGAALQTARKLVDQGVIGRPIMGITAHLSHGMEDRHPNPAFFFRPGAGPVLDIGPYHISSFIHLLGPVARVSALGQIGNETRTVSMPGSPHLGEIIPVEIMTSMQALLQFESGAQVSFLASWDAWKSTVPSLELHGTDGSVGLPDIDWFGGVVTLTRRNRPAETIETDAMSFGLPNHKAKAGPVANYRGLGLADMAHAIETGGPFRASGAMGLHVLAVMEAITASAAASGQSVEVKASCARPEPLGEDLARALLK